MGLTTDQLCAALDSVSAIEPRFAAAVAAAGYPEPRHRDPGYETLLRTIVGQQISFKAADAVWARLAVHVGKIDDPLAMAITSDESLRAAGLSRQKIAYARSLSGAVVDGTLNLSALPADDEAAIAALTMIKGIGRWSAEVYLLFAEGRPDIWPAGDLAVQEDVGRILQLDTRPSERDVRLLGEAWRPHRGAVAVFAWHHYQRAVI